MLFIYNVNMHWFTIVIPATQDKILIDKTGILINICKQYSVIEMCISSSFQFWLPKMFIKLGNTGH